jgi:hypothetical protein
MTRHAFVRRSSHLSTITIPTDRGEVVIEYHKATGAVAKSIMTEDDGESGDAVESLLLALVCAGVITPENARAAGEAVNTAIDAIANHF